jgi:hypothetical protein
MLVAVDQLLYLGNGQPSHMQTVETAILDLFSQLPAGAHAIASWAIVTAIESNTILCSANLSLTDRHLFGFWGETEFLSS